MLGCYNLPLISIKRGVRNFNIIYANCSKGQSNKGVGNVIKNLGDITSLFKNMKQTDIPAKYFDNKKGYSKLRTEVYDTHERGDIPFTIGGDHSIAIGSVAGSLDFYKNDLTVIWIDAHADINTYEASQTKNLHGMPLSFLTGLDNTFINMHGNELSTNNLLYYGLRDVDVFEKKFLNENKIQYMTAIELMEDVYDYNDKLIIPTEKVHLSVDVDVLDPTFMSSTGTTVSKGLTSLTLYNLIRRINDKSDIVAIDLVEYNPECANYEQQQIIDHSIMTELVNKLLKIGRKDTK